MSVTVGEDWNPIRIRSRKNFRDKRWLMNIVQNPVKITRRTSKQEFVFIISALLVSVHLEDGLFDAPLPGGPNSRMQPWILPIYLLYSVRWCYFKEKNRPISQIYYLSPQHQHHCVHNLLRSKEAKFHHSSTIIAVVSLSLHVIYSSTDLQW